LNLVPLIDLKSLSYKSRLAVQGLQIGGTNPVNGAFTCRGR